MPPPIRTWYQNTTPNDIHLHTTNRYLKLRLDWSGQIHVNKFKKLMDEKVFFFLVLTKKGILNYVYQVTTYADGCYLDRVPDNAVKCLFPYDSYEPPKTFAGSWRLPCCENPLDLFVCD